MAKNQLVTAMNSLMYDLFQATTMLLFLLSSASANRRQQYVAEGKTIPLQLRGLPELCLSPAIVRVPDDDLYGPEGVAVQMAFKGWVAEAFGFWESRYRRQMQEAFGPSAIPPEMNAFGDLRRIRNDLFHNNAKASIDHCGKCKILTWFAPGESMVLGVRHALDFLNQTGVLSFGDVVLAERFRFIRFNTICDRDTLLNWVPRPKLVSVRTHGDGRDEEPPCKGVTVVFDNGLFANVAFTARDRSHWESCGDAVIDRDGDLVFASGDRVRSAELYRFIVVGLKGDDDTSDHQLRRPVAGPAIRFGRRWPALNEACAEPGKEGRKA